MINTTLIRAGRGRKDSNAALAEEFFATLTNTHGNSQQAKSLTAILRRAEERYASKVARKAEKAASAEDAPKERKTRKARTPKADQASEQASEAVASSRPRRESNAEARERRHRERAEAIAEDNANASR